jgi:hypothetical protein
MAYFEVIIFFFANLILNFSIINKLLFKDMNQNSIQILLIVIICHWNKSQKVSL